MKNFIKKYPKRIIITALVVLLIAIIGTVNNYRTYRDENETRITERYYVRQYIDKDMLDFMVEIYGEDELSFEYRFDTEELYLKSTGKSLETYVQTSYPYNVSEKLFKMSLGRESYSSSDTVTVKLENKMLNDVSFYGGKYLLQIHEKNYRWFDINNSAFNNDEYEDLICLRKGESYEFEIPLNSFFGADGEPIELIPGEYKVAMLFFVLNDPKDTNNEDRWITCEFDIK